VNEKIIIFETIKQKNKMRKAKPSNGRPNKYARNQLKCIRDEEFAQIIENAVADYLKEQHYETKKIYKCEVESIDFVPSTEEGIITDVAKLQITFKERLL
jgi:hypothetical protein